MNTDFGTDFAELHREIFYCFNIAQEGNKWKDHSEEYLQAQQHGNSVEAASPRF